MSQRRSAELLWTYVALVLFYNADLIFGLPFPFFSDTKPNIFQMTASHSQTAQHIKNLKQTLQASINASCNSLF